jgi:hypothetical protein
VGPHALSGIDVGAGHIDGHRACGRIDAIDQLHKFLGQALADQVVALLDELSRHESPLVAAAHEERVLGRRLDPAVDDYEPVVLAEFHAPHAGHCGFGASHAPMREPPVLRLVGHIRFQAGYLDRCDLIAGFEVLNGRETAIAKANERAEEQAVGATATPASSSATTAPASSATTSTAAAATSASTGGSSATAAAARTTATGPASTRRTATPARRTPAAGRSASARGSATAGGASAAAAGRPARRRPG